ncbi:serine hydrolase domain-containing protein [Aquisalinus flavus]|uniref:Serine hydrolase n=1 Tax=Aquisalinus flavus TaxID=1526572 RepID=A0A8J2V4Q9_9PROT|nr:serine hydrolase domain-containing protein [Aquisalinus flavus]MBD0427236.1 beta-lactamase family protein [Aquisalinus flavus]UNE47050.1 beta-lactamase family protein [Aquisalinus flavus]GGC99395.1 serine hydrolase [Aquisalinus flavus]
MKNPLAALLSAALLTSGGGMTTAHAQESAFTVQDAVIDETLQAYVETGRIAGATALVWQDGEEVYAGSFGMADREAGRAMSRDTLFQIYSMTKPVTGVALMTLWEDGKFDLDDPLSDYLPEFADMTVFAGFDADGEPVFEPAKRAIKVIDILRHTAGLGYASEMKEYPAHLYREAGVMDNSQTLDEFSQNIASQPLYYQPGGEWKYSASVSVQARLVEVLSGQEFDTYLRETIFEPLGMDSATRYVAPEDRERLAGFYSDASGTLERVPDIQAYAGVYNRSAFQAGGFGLVMEIDDYMRFARMLLNGGALDGARILEAETVELMATDHLPATVQDVNWLRNKGQAGFGLNFAVRIAPPLKSYEASGAVGEFFWDGYASTLFWVDPANDLAAVLLVQKVPFDEIGLHKAFRDAVYAGSAFAAPQPNGE